MSDTREAAVQIVDDERYDMDHDDFPHRVVDALDKSGRLCEPGEVEQLRARVAELEAEIKRLRSQLLWAADRLQSINLGIDARVLRGIALDTPAVTPQVGVCSGTTCREAGWHDGRPTDEEA